MNENKIGKILDIIYFEIEKTSFCFDYMSHDIKSLIEECRDLVENENKKVG